MKGAPDHRRSEINELGERSSHLLFLLGGSHAEEASQKKRGSSSRRRAPADPAAVWTKNHAIETRSVF